MLQPSQPWNLAKCRQLLSDKISSAGHVCTAEHLEADFSVLARWLGRSTNAENPAELARLAVADPELTELAETGFVEALGVRGRLATEEAATIKWVAGSLHSREFLVQGSKVRMIVTGSLSVLAFIESNEDPLRVRMHFLNKSEQPFDVIPDTFTLAVIEPRTKAKTLSYLSPKQVAKRIQDEATWLMVAEALSSMGRAMSGTSTTTSSGTVRARDTYGRSAYGTYNGVTTTYDHAANQQQTAANIARITDAAEARKIRETTGALLPNTVFPGDEYVGVVHFKREKRAEVMLLRAPVRGQVFEFPLEMPGN